MDHFILLSEYSVNHDMVQFAQFLPDGSVTLHMGANMLTFAGDDAAILKTAFGRDTPPATEMAETESAPASNNKKRK